MTSLSRLDDRRLAELVRRGDAAAFEAIYDRHHAALLAFCRHMLRSREDGEDALQQTFVRAHRALSSGPPPDALRTWLFAIARNRCRTMLAARRPPTLPVDEHEGSFDGLAEAVRHRAELRELVADLQALPDPQREALVMFELGGLPHSEIGRVIGCPPARVKALVFQAREALVAERDARCTPCEDIRSQLATARGGALRRAGLRRHLRGCEPCQAYRVALTGRGGLASILPVAPTLGLKAAILAATGSAAGGSGKAAAAVAVGAGGSAAGGGAAATTGGGAGAAASAATAGGLAVKAVAAKVAVTAAVAGIGVTGVATVEKRGEPEARPVAQTAERVAGVRPARSATPTPSATATPSPTPGATPEAAGRDRAANRLAARTQRRAERRAAARAIAPARVARRRAARAERRAAARAITPALPTRRRAARAERRAARPERRAVVRAERRAAVRQRRIEARRQRRPVVTATPTPTPTPVATATPTPTATPTLTPAPTP